MLRSLLTKAPLLALSIAVLVFVIAAGIGLGVSGTLLLGVTSTVFAITEGYALWALRKKNEDQGRLLRHLRFAAERAHATLRHAPASYCLFTPQGLLREEHEASALLGLEKVSHLDELLGAFKDSAAFLAAFRGLQLSGEPFSLDVITAHTGRPVRLYGRRFRLGVDGPQIDGLWFLDLSPKAAEQKVASTPTSPPPPSPPAPPPASQSPQKIFGPCLDALPFPLWARDTTLRLVACNEAYAAALETSKLSVLDEQIELMVVGSPAGRALAQTVIKTAALADARDHAVIAGKRRLLHVTEAPFERALNGENNAIAATFGFAIDVTAEEEKEEELRRHLVSHHEVMEQLSAAICVFGADHRMEFYNRAYQRLWEATDVFLDGKPTFSEVLEDLRARRRLPEQADFQKYKKEQTSLFTSLLEPREEVLYLPDETCLRVMIAPHPLGGLMFVYENVTDQLALETSYNTLMAVQRETIDNLAQGIAVFGPDGRLRLSNAALALLWGLDKAFLDTEPHVSVFLENARALVDTTNDWEARKGDLVGYALHRMPRSGRMGRTDDRVVEFLTVPLPDGSVLNSFLDVTDSYRVEQALRASNAALAAADRLKSDFVANVSYQLRTPLNTITGFAEILVEQYFGALNDRQMDYTRTIKAESEKLARLINDVLDLATIEAGRMTLERRAINIASLLNDVKAMTADWARQQSLDILIDCPSNLGSFEVDEQRVKQVLFNLISNAIKYTPAGGRIALAAWKQDEWIIVSVLDTGVGIPEDDRDRIFGKFERANAHLRQNGAGLGLSLVKSFVELHGGRVEVFSDAKDGTKISCFFPQKAPKKALPAQGRGASA